jgi:short-subunit dehydrogenase
MAQILCDMGFTVYGIARREERLKEIKEKYDSFIPVEMDLSIEENIYKLYKNLENEDIDIFINNAGFGVFGSFVNTDINKELDMININIRSLHILTKLFSQKFLKQGYGKILNVASSAGFMAGPLLSSYYASKAYVLRLSEAVDEELRRQNKNVTVSVLCPGPVRTEFDEIAGVSFALSGLESSYVALYAIRKMLKGKRVIIPGFSMKLLVFFSRFVPGRLLTKITYNIQRKKGN